jgi:hypothetical protein
MGCASMDQADMQMNDTHLVCDTQPLCLCIGESTDQYAQYECECTGNVVGCSKEKCENCGALMVETVDE